MGLDMYAYKTREKFTQSTDFEFDYESAEKIAQWRKFNNLHGWMERLYREKGGQAEDFNCTPLELTLEDLSRLEQDAHDGENLEPTAGFFFGDLYELSQQDENEIRDFVHLAQDAIKDGYTVFYDSWW